MAKLKKQIVPSTAIDNKKTKTTTVTKPNAVNNGRVNKMRRGVNLVEKKKSTIEKFQNDTQLLENVDNNAQTVLNQKKRKCVVRLKRISVKPKKHHQNSVFLSRNNEELTNVTSSSNLCETSFRSAEQVSPTIQTQNGNIESPKIRNLTVRLLKTTPPSRANILNNDDAIANVKAESLITRIDNARLIKETLATKANILPSCSAPKLVKNFNLKIPKLRKFTARKAPTSTSKNSCAKHEDEIKELQNAPTEKATIQSKNTHKFFQRKNPEKTAGSRIKEQTSKSLSKRKSSTTRNVYEFMSLNDTENEKRVDPAADIVKKLIEDGKVSVTKFLKGQGKARVKHKKKKKIRPVGRRRQCSLDDVADNPTVFGKVNVAAISKPTRPPPPTLSPVYEPEYDHDNDFHDEDNDENVQEDRFEQEVPANPLEIIFEDTEQAPKQIELNTNQSKNAESGFSNLTRSVLINQAKRQKPDLAHQQRLLDVARKFVSTPVNKKKTKTGTLNVTNLSPIAAPARPTPLNGCLSPWRAPDELILPRTFIFGRDNSNLPSFSCDFIPCTPKKQKKNVSSTTVNETLEKSLAQPGIITSPERLDESLLPSTNPTSILSPYSANNSNGENLPPIKILSTNNSNTSATKTPNRDFVSEKHDKENFVHLPNPRRTLQNRMPFKAINILEVITLPSWKTNAITKPTDELLSKTINNDIVQAQAPNARSPVKDKLFGFEDFLNNSQLQESNDENLSSSSGARDNCPKKVGNDSSLHDMLKGLREMCPMDVELPQPSKIPVRYVFDDANMQRQRKIKEMLCSTMVQNDELKIQNKNDADESQNLFNDPETTFDGKAPRVTYERPFKRKRKQRHNFVTFMDSDISEEDDDEELHPKNKNANKNKRTRKEETELNKFVTTFNTMCHEVDQYDLVVE